MFYKRCDYCKKQIEYTSKCNCKKHKTNSDLYKNECEKHFYNSKAWLNARKEAIEKTNHLDIYSFYINNSIEQGHVVHHIKDIKTNWDDRLEPNNLIYLTHKNHRLVHLKMNESKQSCIDIQNLLLHLLINHNIL